MAFQYRLEVLLRVQLGRERQEENRLLACAALVARLKTQLQELQEARLGQKQSSLQEMELGVASVFLQVATEWDAAVLSRQVELSTQLAVAEQARLAQLQVYRAARQKREVLESLKVQQKSAYTQEQLRRLQHTMDDTFLTRAFFFEKS